MAIAQKPNHDRQTLRCIDHVPPAIACNNHVKPATAQLPHVENISKRLKVWIPPAYVFPAGSRVSNIPRLGNLKNVGISPLPSFR